MLSKDPAQRPQSVKEIPALFEAALNSPNQSQEETEPDDEIPTIQVGASEENTVPPPPDTPSDIPSEEILAAVNQALAKMDGGLRSGDTNSRAVFFELNRKYQENAVSRLIEVFSQSGESLNRWRAAKLLEYYLRMPSAQKLKGRMIDILSQRLSVESDEDVRGLIVTIIKEAPVVRNVKFQYLRSHLGTIPSGSVKNNLISALGEFAPPEQRDTLAAEYVEILATTGDWQTAYYTAQVIENFKYRQAIPDLMNALWTAPSNTASYIANLLHSLTLPGDTQAREQLAAFMTDLMIQTLDSSLASVAAKTIKEFNYRKAIPTLTELLCITNNSSIGSQAADVIKAFQYREALPLLREAVVIAPLDVAVVIADLLVAFRDKEGIPALQTRIEYDQYGSSSSVVSLCKALYDLQGESSVEFLVRCFEESQLCLQTSWIDFFKERGISKAREAVQRVRDESTNDSTRQKADEFLRAVPIRL